MRLVEASLFVAGILVASGCGRSKELTEICAAVEAKNVGEVRRLLQQGDVDLNAGQGTTGLRCNPFPAALERVEPEALTADRRGLEIATLMLDYKADLNSCWQSGSLPLRSSSSRGSSSREVVRPCVLEYAVNSQSPRFLRLVIDRGARVRSGTGARALAAAAYAGNMEMAKMLVEAGAPVNDVPKSGGGDRGSRTPALGAAIAGGHEDMIAYVRGLPGAREFPAPSRLSGLASVVSRLFGGQGGLTAGEQAFMSAAQSGDVAALEKAIAEGVQVDRLDGGKSALIRASDAGHVAAVELLLRAGADPNLMISAKTALHLAAANGHVQVIRVLVQAKADLNRRFSANDDTPLMAAVKAEKPDAVRALIDAGADTTVSDHATTALEYAVWRANTAVVRDLVKDGRTPVNARHPTAQGSPLHGALACSSADYNIELIQTLLAAGADLAATDKNGDTPIRAVERKRAAEKLPSYLACYDAQVAALRAAATR